MAFEDVDPAGTDAALREMIARPAPIEKPRTSSWAQMGAVLGAPLRGAATAVNETARAASAAMGYLDTAGASSQRHDGPFEAERQQQQVRTRQQYAATDAQLRSGAEFWKPDPSTASTATQLLFDASRVLTKAAAYSLAGGLPGMVVGTGLDEGVTTTLGLEDRGVDPTTATKVGVVHGAMTAATVGLPVVGSTIPRTIGLIAASGPGSFMAEQAITRKVLSDAHYEDLAAEFDPFDRTGLTVSTLIPAVIGTAAHVIRARTPVSPDVVDAAHVSYANEVADQSALVPSHDIVGMQAHHDTLEVVRQQLDAGDAASVVPTAQINPRHANEVLAGKAEKFDAEMRTMRDSPLDEEITTARTPLRDSLDAPLPPRTELHQDVDMSRARMIASERPDLPIKLSEADDAPTMGASDYLDHMQAEADQDRLDGRAYAAAVECWIARGESA